jgi:hypothetical protein
MPAECPSFFLVIGYTLQIPVAVMAIVYLFDLAHKYGYFHPVAGSTYPGIHTDRGARWISDLENTVLKTEYWGRDSNPRTPARLDHEASAVDLEGHSCANSVEVDHCKLLTFEHSDQQDHEQH